MYHANVNVDLMEESVIRINGRIMINVGVSVKGVMYVKKFRLGIRLHVIVKMKNIQHALWLIQRLRVMKLRHTKKKKILMKKATCKAQNCYIVLAFLLITSITGSCQYLMLSDKILSKTKTFTTISR